MALIVDLVLLALGLFAIAAGIRHGALSAAASLVGLAAGFALGGVAAPVVVGWLTTVGWGTTVERTIAAALTVAACCGICYAIAHGIVGVVVRHVRNSPARRLDQLVGGAMGVVTWAAAVWLLAGFVQTTGLTTVAQYASSSRVVSALNGFSPVSATTALGALDNVLGHAGLPRVFQDGTESIRAAQAPDSTIPGGAMRASDSVVKVLAAEPRCGTDSEGSGWVLAPGRVMTNAHVVAGSTSIAIQVGGTGMPRPARLVVFDPRRDLAVLDVPGLTAPPLALANDLGTGDSAVVAGFPNNGPYDVQPARIREVVQATGSDIYHSDTVVREVYSLRGVVRSGNSGGPLLTESGQVAGVVFARSSIDSDTGYALTAREIAPAVAAAGSSAVVSSGACTTG